MISMSTAMPCFYADARLETKVQNVNLRFGGHPMPKAGRTSLLGIERTDIGA
jgi:hypothetical protein